MKRRGIILAAALVLASDAFVLFKSKRNRSGSPVAAIQLTERELRLARPQQDSTALFLELEFEPLRSEFKFENGPGWFDRTKLEELGYDCRLPVTDPSARSHYMAVPAKQAFVVLQYGDSTSIPAAAADEFRPRLSAVDVGRDYAVLRQKHADTRRFLIVPGVVSLLYEQKWDVRNRKYLPGAYLRGAVDGVIVGTISLDSADRRILASLGQTTREYVATPEARTRGPRYSATLYYGRNMEPWIGSCRLLTATPQ